MHFPNIGKVYFDFVVGLAGLVAELDEKDKSIIFGMIETMLTKKKFKDFFNKNAAML